MRLPNLHAFRFFAALGVIIFHVEHKKHLFGLPSLWHINFFTSHVGYHAVTFFFVLSGFLITHLLLKEIDQRGKINFKNFYLRRILRIGPVFYITLLIGFFILPALSIGQMPGQSYILEEKFWPTLTQSIFFISNLTLVMYGSVPGFDQSWSVSTEEQFYLLWPLVLTLIARPRLPAALICIIIAGCVIRFLTKDMPIIGGLAELNRFGCMSIGALAAYYLNRGQIRWLLNSYAFGASAVVAIAIMCSVEIYAVIVWIEPELISVAFAVFILNISLGRQKSLPLEGPLFTRLGNYSYSAYMYHNAIIIFVLNLAMRHGMQSNVIIYGTILAGTFVASALSWKFVENPVLDFKDRMYSVKLGIPVIGRNRA